MAMSRISAVFDANTSGLTAGTKEATAALRALGGDISAIDSTFAKLQTASTQGLTGIGPAADLARNAMASLREGVGSLETYWQAGVLTIGEYRRGLLELAEESGRAFDAVERGSAVTRKFMTDEERGIELMGEYARLFNAGAIGAETYARAMEYADGIRRKGNESASEAVKLDEQSASAKSRAASVIASIQTAEEKHAATLRELSSLLTAGELTWDQYLRATEKADTTLKESSAAFKAVTAAEKANAEAMREGAAVTREVATAKERYRSRVTELRQLLLNGAITQQTFSRAVNAAEKEMRQASAASTAYGSAASGLSGVMSRLNVVIALQVTQLATQLVGAVSNAARSLLSMGNDAQEAVDKMARLSARTGQTYQEIATLELAGRLAGVGIDQLATATARADRLFVAAGNGSKQAAAAFKTIGLSFEELDGLAPDERFNRIAASIAALPTPAQQTAAAIAIFGRSGAELVPMFQEVGGRMGEIREQAERFGLALSDSQVAGIAEMNDSLDLAYAAIQGIVNQVTAGLAPALTEVANLWSGFVAATGGASIGAGIVEILLDGAEVVARVFDYAASVIRPVWEYAAQVVNGLGGVANVWNGVAIVMQSVVLAFQGVLSAIGAVGSAFGAAITKLMSGLLGVAAKVAEFFGKDELANTIKGMQDYTDRAAKASYENMIALGQQSGEQFAGAVENIWNPEKFGFAMGNAAAGTWENEVEKLRGRLREGQAEAADSVRKAGDGAVAGISAAVETKLASALDARSKEGNKELIRLMYGSNRGQIEERQLQAQERMADGIDDLNDNIDNLGMEAFAF